MTREIQSTNDVQVDLQRENVSTLIKEFHAKAHTPELILTTFQQIWAYRGLLISESLPQPLAPIRQLNRTHAEIQKREAQGRRLGYLPPEVSTETSRNLLGAMFPEMGSHSTDEENLVSNERVITGWLDYETDIDPPYLGTREDVPALIARQGRHTMNLTEYIILGQDSKSLTDKYFDQNGTWTALPDSRFANRIVYANFTSKGKLSIISWSESPEILFPKWGWRSIGAI